MFSRTDWTPDIALFNSYTLAATLLSAFVLYRYLGAKGSPSPPGPSGWPIIGCLFEVPQIHPWVAFKKWGDQYNSDIVSFTVLGKSTVIVNSYAAAQDLFSKRSSIYSHRPDMPMVNDLMHWDEWGLGQMQYGPDWKDQRKMFRQEVEFSEATLHRPHVLRAARRFLKNVLRTPDDYFAHLRHLTGFSVLSTAYGIEVKPRGDPLVQLAERAMYAISRAGNFGSYLVDFMPILKYIPTWFPGAQFKRDAREWSKYVKALPDAGFRLAKAKYVRSHFLISVK
ncbi:cytochrome P450 [Pluteus cervinus]|uniref:Cytochrome P450 n=1 Tax=Pluteus cervinus TaxID=181527 RepID=A0ACD3A7B1_9AGAR|nr:cytochrome P450 [Pluteus cervinus]